MGKLLKWKKGFFESTYEIYSEGKLVGSLRENSWKQSAEGELNGKRYNFKTKGFFKQETRISDPANHEFTGKINYNNWKTRARLEYAGQVVKWQYDNFWSTRWSLSDSRGTLIRYRGSSSKGDIDIKVEDDLLVLSGLYITSYFWQASAIVIVAVFLPIWVAILH